MIRRRRIGCAADAVTVFETVFGDRSHAFCLAVDAEVSVLGAADDGDGSLLQGDASAPVYELLRTVLAERPQVADGGVAPGWFGWLGYELGAHAAGAPTADDESGVPQLALMRASRLLLVDERSRELELVWLDGDEGWLADVVALCAALRPVAPDTAVPGDTAPSGDASAGDRSAGHLAGELVWRQEPERYLALVEACRAAIAAGDAYQLCLTDTATSTARPHPSTAYRSLRAASPTATGGLVVFGGSALVSASPERFLEVEASGRVVSRPIKGTRPRGAGPAADEAARRELAADEKERAENLMIVDLVRNDLSRFAALGSVVVTGLLEVESYAQLHQLVSTVEARLAPGRTAVDAVAAAFPAGSMTGAPKLSAMTILHGLEQGPRGVYAGCFGRFGLDGSAVLNMAIRSVVIGPGGSSIGSGGGITALSDPRRELAEQRLKAELPGRVLRTPHHAG